ncbi:MAG: nuclear transport factor 2 family protein [Arenimonas sp.]
MKLLLVLLTLSLLVAVDVGRPSLAQSSIPAATIGNGKQIDKPSAPVLSIAPEANAAVQVVDSFMAKLASGDLSAAEKFLDPGLVVISNGIIQGSRSDYLNGPAKTDAAYLQKNRRQLLRRQARADTSFAWVISEKALFPQNAGKSTTQLVSETMLLAKTPAGWKIMHIHWSSHVATGS